MIILNWLWTRVSDKHHVFVTCLTLCLIGIFAIAVDVRGDDTTWEIIHNHSKRLSIFNAESDSNQNKMIASLKDEIAISAELSDLKADIRAHRSRLYELTDVNGQFKSQFHKVMWEAQNDDDREELKRLQKKFDGSTSEFETRMMFAMRSRL